MKVIQKMAQNRKNTRRIGNKGEDIACVFLSDRGFHIVDRNYQRKWGELDIVAIKDQELHFFEVKSVTLHVGWVKDHFPEDNVHGLKLRSIGRMIETYMEDKNCSRETPFHFHVLSVYMDVVKRRARVKWLKNLIV
jgi:putative endonuclease